jgi:hypothetical protein
VLSFFKIGIPEVVLNKDVRQPYYFWEGEPAEFGWDASVRPDKCFLSVRYFRDQRQAIYVLDYLEA